MTPLCIHKIFSLWQQLYPDESLEILRNFVQEISAYKTGSASIAIKPGWYKDAVVYSLYVDLFNHDFKGLCERLPYLESLGVTCLWLLPLLESPMRDAGFDISDHYRLRKDLLQVPSGEQEFDSFLAETHSRQIRVIFDLPINHTSDQHPWFRDACSSKDNPYRNFYIWSRDASEFREARVIFKGIESSNWERCGDEYYFHRFFSFQPDLNYRNPGVLFAMCRVLLYWQQRGVDGFRADAIPYLWKEEGTACENLSNTHNVIRFFRAVLDYVKPGTLLLAEACQKPADIVAYFGEGDECHAAYHFPLMPRIFLSMAREDGTLIKETLSPVVTPPIPESSQWFTFLRCHDELSLELVYVTEEERAAIHGHYCRRPEWDFRLGEGISARLSELFDRDPRRMLLAWSIILTLPGTPVIYYGDETGKGNDEAYYREMINITSKDDTRFLVRGRIDWESTDQALKAPGSYESSVFYPLKRMIETRKQHPAFGRGTLSFLDTGGKDQNHVLAYFRDYQCERILVIQNLTSTTVKTSVVAIPDESVELFGNPGILPLEPYGFRWFKIEKTSERI